MISPLFQSDIPPKYLGEEKILVIKLGALGDFIQALGPMAAIRRHHPAAHITLLTTSPFVEAAKKSGYFNDFWIDTRPKWHEFIAWKNLRQKMNDSGFYRVYDLQNNDRTSVYFKLFKHKPEWVGTAAGASHKNASPERIARQAYFGHVQTLALAGIDDIEIDTLEWMDTDVSRFTLPKPYALIVPGSAANRTEKRWPLDHYSKLCEALLSERITPIIIGAQGEKILAESIARDHPQCVDLVGQTNLYDIVSLARDAALAIGNDTGPMHLIAPTGIPTIVLFTKHTDPSRHAPIGAKVKTLNQENLTPKMILDSYKELFSAN